MSQMRHACQLQIHWLVEADNHSAVILVTTMQRLAFSQTLKSDAPVFETFCKKLQKMILSSTKHQTGELKSESTSIRDMSVW